jgi:hypothetical protein
MKSTCLSILLLATSAVAYREGLMQDDRRRRNKGVPGNNRALATGDKPSEKGMKGMGGMKLGMKGKSVKDKSSKVSSKGMGMKDKVKKGCQSLKVKSPFSDVEGGFSPTDVGSTVTFPVYEYDTGELIGTYTKASTDIFVDGEFADCTHTESFNLGFDDSLEYPFTNQIMLAGTCFGANNAITGGTGEYACAAGSGAFIAGLDFFAVELTICNTCA